MPSCSPWRAPSPSSSAPISDSNALDHTSNAHRRQAADARCGARHRNTRALAVARGSRCGTHPWRSSRGASRPIVARWRPQIDECLAPTPRHGTRRLKSSAFSFAQLEAAAGCFSLDWSLQHGDLLAAFSCSIFAPDHRPSPTAIRRDRNDSPTLPKQGVTTVLIASFYEK
jgi:hypothetical protein